MNQGSAQVPDDATGPCLADGETFVDLCCNATIDGFASSSFVLVVDLASNSNLFISKQMM